jgi:uncharacterized membrane protein YdjX (TVP38/TMEM64 family)
MSSFEKINNNDATLSEKNVEIFNQDNTQDTTSISTGRNSPWAEDESLHAHHSSDNLSDTGQRIPLIPSSSRPQPRKGQVWHWTRKILVFSLVNWYKFAILGLLITLIVLVSIHGFGVFGRILAWFQKHNGWAGWGIFIPMYIGVVALFIPGVIFITGAGFVFGFWRGLLAVWIGGAVGQALAFLLARYLLHDWVHDFVSKKWSRWDALDKAIELDGWKLVLVMRLSPIIPYNLLNIAMATTSMPFWQFTIVSAVGIIFECAVFTYFGTIAEDITSIVSGDAGPPKVFKWVLLGLSVAMCTLTAVMVSIFVRRAIRRAEAHVTSDTERGGHHDTTINNNNHNNSGSSGLTHTFQRLLALSPARLEREGFVNVGEYDLVANNDNNNNNGDDDHRLTMRKGSVLPSWAFNWLNKSSFNGTGNAISGGASFSSSGVDRELVDVNGGQGGSSSSNSSGRGGGRRGGKLRLSPRAPRDDGGGMEGSHSARSGRGGGVDGDGDGDVEMGDVKVVVVPVRRRPV